MAYEALASAMQLFVAARWYWFRSVLQLRVFSVGVQPRLSFFGRWLGLLARCLLSQLPLSLPKLLTNLIIVSDLVDIACLAEHLEDSHVAANCY